MAPKILGDVGVSEDSLISTMDPRRRRGAKKKAIALRSFISSQEAHELKRLVHELNEVWISERAALGEQVAAVIEAAAVVPYPGVPRRAAELFAALAEGQTFQYWVHPMGVDERAPASWRRHGYAVVTLRPPHVVRADGGQDPSEARGFAVLELGRFFRNSARGRLRRCQQCGTWFIDTTRNKSALRCSRACTIAWSNSQRSKRGER